MENKRMWYIVQTYSGFENSVKDNLLRRIETMQMENLIFQVMIPEELKTEKKADGSTKEKMIKMFPGYVFIEMIVTDDSWFVVLSRVALHCARKSDTAGAASAQTTNQRRLQLRISPG